MRFLLISLVFVVLVGCATYPNKYQLTLKEDTTQVYKNSYFSDPEIDYVYKAQIDVYDKHFGGIFIVKKIAAKEHRVVFTTEMGSKILDFSFKDDDFSVNYILEELNKKILINLLRKDFKTLITEEFNNEALYSKDEVNIVATTLLKKKHYYYYESKSLKKIIKAKRAKEKVAFYFSEISDNIAKKIEIQHKSIQLKINLKSLKK